MKERGKMAKKEKTNVMRALEQQKIPYTAHQYPHEGKAVDGTTVAGLIGKDAASVYKTLVTEGVSGEHYVFVVPVCKELDLKKAARAVGEKAVCMVHVAELQRLTGYVRGGCSPIGMEKHYQTVLHSDAQNLDFLVVSAGRIGEQVELKPQDLLRVTRGTCADVARSADGKDNKPS